MPLLRQRRGHWVTVHVDARCVWACVLGQGCPGCSIDKLLSEPMRPGPIATNIRLHLSGEWRMFLRAADLTVVFLSTVLIVTQLTCTTTRTHAYFTHSFAHHFLCCHNKEEEHKHTPHSTTLWWPRSHKQIPSHAHALLFASGKLTLGEHRHSIDCVWANLVGMAVAFEVLPGLLM